MKKKDLTEPDYEKIGKAIVSLQDVFVDKKRLYKTAFIKGLFSGLGGVVGATLLVAVLLWVLSFFHTIPLIGNFTETIRNTIQTQ